jgi:phosphomannomutase
MSLASRLRTETMRWIADDVDSVARQELQQVLARAMAGDQPAIDDLTARMSGPLAFGTAGLRAPVRAGRNGMNAAVVVRTTAGVAEWLRHNGFAGRIVVIGRDARHGSELFCTQAAEVLAAAGFDVRVLPEPLPTPVVAFAVRSLGAAAGIQITASHNPPADNGYKLFAESGAQIVPPADAEIEGAIAAAPAAISVPRNDSYTVLDDDLVESYCAAAAAVRRSNTGDIRIALTPMHGVGGATAVEALRRSGFTDVRVVEAQAAPDAEFPTVTFPNPEEPGAADLLLSLAADSGADVAVALDPDADRCAIGVSDVDGWRMLRGDETGVLLGEYVLRTTTAENPLVATTIVSSSMLRRIAAARGARYDETPTGFKWLVRAGDGYGTGLIFAYEEALGLCVDPDVVRDKDGISAAVLAADLVTTLTAEGRSVPAELDALYAAHGVHRTGQVSLRFNDLSLIAGLMRRLRADPPARLLDTDVTTVDLLPGNDALRISGSRVRVVVRPSGTEPKLKAYLEIALEPAEDVTSAKALARDLLARLDGEVRTLLAH